MADQLTSVGDAESISEKDPRNLKTNFSLRHLELLEQIKEEEEGHDETRSIKDSGIRNLHNNSSKKLAI